MRWALHKVTAQPIYVGWLSAHQNGNSCSCECPACGEELQAVNAGKDASHFRKANTLGMFFRHPSGHQRKDCSFLVAKLAALHLLMDSGEVDLPPPRRAGIHHGASGTSYTAEAVGQAWRGRITDKVWVDSQSARITIDGRTVLVQLQARPDFSSNIAVDGVIIIRVNDQIVASWEPSQILQAMKIDSDFACWEKHWDGDELSAEAQKRAMAAADEAVDRVPPELGSLDGFSNLHKSETVLHAKVKEILFEAGRLRVPFCEREVVRVMHDGSQKRLLVHIDSQDLILSEVRLEVPLQGLVPDVMCIARSSRNSSESFPLLIEVAVTHRVDAAKKALIASFGLGCVEIDLTRLGMHQRRITVAQLQSAVIDDLQCKSWVSNLLLARAVKRKELELELEDNELRAVLQREEKRKQWLDELTVERLIELLMPVLRHHWLTEGAMSVDDKYYLLPQEIAARLTYHGFKDANDPLLLSKEGLLHYLDDIRNRHISKRSLGKWSGLWQLAKEPKLQKYLTLGLMALKVYPLNLSPQDADRITDLRMKVKESLDTETRTYARPATHDEIIGTLFPPLRERLSNPAGTLKALQKKVHERQVLERQKAAEEARTEAKRAAEVQRKLQLLHDQRRKESEEKAELKQKIEDLLSRERVYTWKPDILTTTIEPVLRQFSVSRLVRNYSRSGMDVEALLRGAWESRARGHAFRVWLDGQAIADTAKAKMVLEVLRTSGMIS
jgi:hypothetical protein